MLAKLIPACVVSKPNKRNGGRTIRTKLKEYQVRLILAYVMKSLTDF